MLCVHDTERARMPLKRTRDFRGISMASKRLLRGETFGKSPVLGHSGNGVQRLPGFPAPPVRGHRSHKITVLCASPQPGGSATVTRASRLPCAARSLEGWCVGMTGGVARACGCARVRCRGLTLHRLSECFGFPQRFKRQRGAPQSRRRMGATVTPFALAVAPRGSLS